MQLTVADMQTHLGVGTIWTQLSFTFVAIQTRLHLGVGTIFMHYQVFKYIFIRLYRPCK